MSEKSWHPNLPRGVRLREDKVRDRFVLLAPERIYEVDQVGVEILKRCDGRSLNDMLIDLAAAFGASTSDIQNDVEQFLQGFADKRVIEL
jgi:pyrroloquinoline quinone biosynthesis protein D